MYCPNCQRDTGSALETCPQCGVHIPTSYSNQARSFAQSLYDHKPQIAALTTAGNVFVNLGGQQVELVGAADEVSTQQEIEKLLWNYPSLTLTCFTRVENPMRANLAEARTLLLSSVLPIGRSSPSQDRRKVVTLMGAVLDMQTGKDSLVFGKPGTDRVIPRLRIISVPPTLLNDYKSVHPYYNATKHGNKPEHAALLAEIGSDQGRTIVVRFFEYVRRILEWYYRQQAMTDIPELLPIDYTGYGLAI